MPKIKFIIAGITIAAVSLFGSSLKAEAAEWGVDMNLACRQQHGWAGSAYVMIHNARGWRCRAGGDPKKDYAFGRLQINVAKYCAHNHGGAKAVVRDEGNPYSWRCVK